MIQSVNYKYLESQLLYSNYSVREPYERGDTEFSDSKP